MSESLEKNYQQNEEKVVITPEDAMAAFEFWKQFMPIKRFFNWALFGLIL